MHSLTNDLKQELQQEWDPYYQSAAAKADHMKHIRDTLKNVDVLQTKEQELHFKLLGRLGYNRLDVVNVIHLENVPSLLLLVLVLKWTEI